MAKKKIITASRFVTFIDILGFKNLVDNNTHGFVLKKLDELKIALDEIEKDGYVNLRTWIFSDSILIVSDDDTYESADSIMFNTSKLVGAALKIGLMVKGTIAHGKFTADYEKSIFFGKPLIDAYIMEEEIKLSSILLHHTFEKKIKSYRRVVKLHEGSRCIEYLTPMQKGAVNHLHLNWMEYYHVYDLEGVKNKNKAIDDYSKKLKKLYLSVSGQPRVYIDNTLKFIEKCRECCIRGVGTKT
ncbi:hypothetical protein AAON49_05305 [Pseudotenacibaculum sp. MALMAid0570]|uniref:hypothetical protein n=1 Tax=Pseudotenacibaculum sp. MALMAid0570 TaxID=3143938 RepID=UPI0032DFE5EE